MPVTRKYGGSMLKGATDFSGSVLITTGAESGIDELVPDGSDDVTIPLAIDVSQMKGLYVEIECDDPVFVIFSSSGDNIQLTMTPGLPFIWFTGCGYANPFAGLGGDVVSVELDKVANGGDCRLIVDVIYDPTV
jgi:hypothetical protein